MGFRDVVRSALSKYGTITGRASRSEYWWFFLFYILASFGCMFAIVILLAANFSESVVGLAPLVLLALLPPYFAVTARRLHDKGLTAWVMLLVVVPFGQIAILILCALPGDEGDNAYGPAPQKRAPDEPEYDKSNIPHVEDDD